MDSNKGNTPRQETKILNSETDTSVLEPLSSLTINEKEDIFHSSINSEAEEVDLKLVSEFVPERRIPAVNVQEKIIICLDVCKEAGSSDESDGTFELMKKSIGSFMYLKQKIDTRHVFALLILGPSKGRIVCEFSSDPAEIIDALNQITEIETNEETFNLDSLFDFFPDNLFPAVNSDIQKPPSFVIRLLFLYNRRNCVPTLLSEKYANKISSPYFFIDILWICDLDNSENNKISTIKDHLQALNKSGLSYIFHVTKNSMNIYDVMAKFTAHPLQRPLQKNCKYDFEKPAIEIKT